MTATRRRIAAGLLVLGGLAGFSGTAGAAEKVQDDNWRFETMFTGVDNPCTPEFDDITLTTEWHTVAKRWETSDGSWRYQGSSRSRLSGSAPDGTRYGGHNHFRAQARVADGLVSYVSDDNHLLVGQGTAPDFALRLKVRIDSALDGSFWSFEVLKESTDCRA